jgi:hypothetical protein
LACHVKIYRTRGILNEVSHAYSSGWSLNFQRVRYHYEDGSFHDGYRFIWRWPAGALQPARGQARLPSLAVIRDLIDQAERAGWGNYDAETDDCLFEVIEEELV